MEYTRGEWEAVFGEYQGNGEFVVYQGDTGTICRGDNEMIDWKANAILIAAAPDLLEALKETISELNRAYEWMLENNKMSDVISTQRKSTIEKGKAAIAKAEGR